MKFLKMLLYILGIFFLIAVVYLGADAVLSRIPADSTNSSAGEESYSIYLLSNDVHTDIVFPTTSSLIDWRSVFPPENTLGKDSGGNWIAIGWGDKGFYLNTPEWKDLSFKTAFVAAVGIGETALHVTYHPQMIEDNLCYKVEVTENQYRILIQHVLESLKTMDDKKSILIETTAQYGDADAFYEAMGSYSMFYSCNTWTNEALKKAKLPSGIWTVFDKGILRHYGYGKQ